MEISAKNQIKGKITSVIHGTSYSQVAVEQTDADGCGVETQQSEGDVETMHHPLYYIDHTTGTIIVDRSGNQRVYWGDFVWNADMVLDDIMALVEESV